MTIELENPYFLAFVDYLGYSMDGKCIYRFDFTQAPDIVWGTDWNVTPAGIVPQIQPDTNTVSITGQVKTAHRYLLAKNNTCFSMQDCIDGIIPLLFDEPYSDNIMVLPFGMEFPDVVAELEKHGYELTDIKDLNKEKEDKVIDNLIGNLETQTKNNSTPPEEDDYE